METLRRRKSLFTVVNFCERGSVLLAYVASVAEKGSFQCGCSVLLEKDTENRPT